MEVQLRHYRFLSRLTEAYRKVARNRGLSFVRDGRFYLNNVGVAVRVYEQNVIAKPVVAALVFSFEFPRYHNLSRVLFFLFTKYHFYTFIVRFFRTYIKVYNI